MFPEWTLQLTKVINYINDIILSCTSWYQIADDIRKKISHIIGLAISDKADSKSNFKKYVHKLQSTEDLWANKLYTGKLQALLHSSSGGTIKLEEIHSYFSEM